MQRVIILMLLTCCLAKPNNVNYDSNGQGHVAGNILQRPSPINPDIIGDPKPPERLTMITDPKEAAKYKRETKLNIGYTAPTLPPTQYSENKNEHKSSLDEIVSHAANDHHHRQKREQNPDTKPASKPIVKHTQTSNAGSNNGNNVKSPSSPAVSPVKTEQKHRQKRDAGNNLKQSTTPLPATAHVPLVHKDQIQQVHATNSRPEIGLPVAKPLQAPVVSAGGDIKHGGVKRDIPVPLVPKHPHPEESPKEGRSTLDEHSKKDDKHIVEQKVNSKDHGQQQQFTDHASAENKATISTTSPHPLTRPQPVPVAELLARPKQS